MKKNSILTDNWDKCYICGRTTLLHEHHCIKGTANRKISEKYGLKVPLCAYCHTGSEGVHHNRELDLIYIKRYAQMEFEKHFSYEEFMKIFGKNYR